MFPKVSNGRVDPQLTSILIAKTNENYLAPLILPTVGVQQTSGKLAEMEDEHFRITNPQRAVWDTSLHLIEYKITNDKRYDIDFFDLEMSVPDQLQYKLQTPFDARRDAAVNVQERLRLYRENALATAMTTVGNYTNTQTLAGNDQFSDEDSDPDSVIRTARTAVYNAIGREANVMVMGREVFEQLQSHPFFLSLFRGISFPTPDAMLEVIKQRYNLDAVLVGRARKLTSAEGQTNTFGSVWGKDIVMMYRPSNPGLMQPSFGYNFVHSPSPQMRVDVRRNSNDNGDIVRVMEAYEDKILNFDAGYLIKDAVA